MVGSVDVTSPISSVVPGVGGLVLAVLARTDRALTGRRLAELVAPSASQTGVNCALHVLAASGVVQRERAGPSYLYRLNRDHLAADAITALATMRERLVDRIGQRVASWEIPAEAVWLFGSAARGDGSTSSDVDLVVVRPADVDEDDETWARQLGGSARPSTPGRATRPRSSSTTAPAWTPWPGLGTASSTSCAATP